MATINKAWATIDYTGSGNGTAVFSSDINEGIDREISVYFKGRDLSIERKVLQAGMREIFAPNDGDFILADGGTYNVLKNEL